MSDGSRAPTGSPSDALPEKAAANLDDGDVETALEWCETLTQELLVLHEAGEYEWAVERARDALETAVLDETVDVTVGADRFRVTVDDFAASFDKRRTRRGELDWGVEGTVIHEPTDTEFVVENSMFDRELLDAARQAERAEPRDAAAKHAWRNSRGV